MFNILVISGGLTAAQNFKRQVPWSELQNFNFQFLEIDKCDLSCKYDGVLVFHKSAIPDEMNISVGQFGVTFFFMEPNTKLSYVNRSFINQFDVTYNVADFPFRTNAVQINYNISTYWVGLGVKIISGEHKWLAKPQYDNNFFRNNHFSSRNLRPSIIAPTKLKMQGHTIRDKVIRKHFDKLEVYGKGFLELDDKLDVLKNDKYHYAIENCKVPGYFSEKIIDCFITNTYPIYWGAPDITSFFEPESLIILDQNLIGSHICEYINDNATSLRYDALIESKKRSLYNYNPFIIYGRNAEKLIFDHKICTLRPVVRSLQSKIRNRLLKSLP